MMMSNIIDWSDKEAVKEYKREYRKKKNTEAVKKYHRERGRKYYWENVEKRSKYYKENVEKRSKYYKENVDKHRIHQLKGAYNLSAADFLEMWEKQNGHCANPDCNIKLVDRFFLEEKTEYENDPNLTKGVDYARADVDHDHDYALKHGKCKEMVRGLLCRSCNRNDVLNPDSEHYIHKPKVSDFTE